MHAFCHLPPSRVGIYEGVKPHLLKVPTPLCSVCQRGMTPAALLLALLLSEDPPLMRIGACCTPEPDLRLPPSSISGAQGATRASWVKSHCTCLHDGLLAARNATVGAGEYRHFHWSLTNYSLIEGTGPGGAGGGEGRVTFLLTPCRGRAHLFVKPALLRDGRRMDQLFETEPASGAPTPTWPFPDDRTGVTAQPPDAGLQADGGGGAGLPAVKWGLAAREAGYENALTFRIGHGSYLISVYGESEADFQLAALTHVGLSNPLQRASEGVARQRRFSLSAAWAEGQLALSWNTTGAAMDDTFQLYMLKSPARGIYSAVQRRGICGAELTDLPNGRSSRCVMSTPCGVVAAAQPVGRALLASSAKLAGGPLTVRLRDHDIEVEDEVPYFFTVLRTPADFPVSARELYVGLDTSSSYERVKQVFPDEIVGIITAGVGGMIGLLYLYIARLKRKAQLKLYMVYQDASSATGTT